MCGITGIFCRNNAHVSLDTIVKMAQSLQHRGPDEEGFFINADRKTIFEASKHDDVALRGWITQGNGHVGLGHRRLSIIDLSTGQQPLSNEDGTIWVVFNGEIYNFQEIQAELQKKGHVFQTSSDTEVIVHAWEEWGTESVKKFRGMFAIALWDERQQVLWLVRDRVGKKPLYYYIDNERLIFGSEIKAILNAPDVSKEIDLSALSDYLSLLYVPAPKSIFKSIRKLPAAHYALITKDDIRISAYWDLDFDPVVTMPEKRIIEDLLDILDQATRMRMISEVPLGSFLSGGVDSSAVVALMSKNSNKPVLTNAISFSVAKYDETPYAQKVADLFHTNHHEFHVTPEAVSVIEQLAWHYDEPFADSSAVPTYYVSKMARENVTVSLSGDGGDENFAGYPRYWFDLRENFVRNLVPDWIRQPLFGSIGRLYPKADYLPRIFRGKAFISNVARDPVDAYFFSVSGLYEEEKRKLLNAETLAGLKGHKTVNLFRNIYENAPAADHLSRIQYLDIKTYLCDDILTKVDRASMAVSLEVRCPILDHVFMEYAAHLPGHLKLNGKDGKHILKKALKKYLPDDILYRRKMGFGVPILEWLRHDLKDYAENITLQGEASRQYLNRKRLETMWYEHKSGIKNHATPLWAVMMLNLWYERFA